MTETVKVKCEHLCAVNGPDGTIHNVMFKPTPESVANVRKAAESGRKVVISVDDVSGIHESMGAYYVENVRGSYGNYIFTLFR